MQVEALFHIENHENDYANRWSEENLLEHQLSPRSIRQKTGIIPG